LHPEKTDQIYQLWDELSDFGANDSDLALKHCLKRLCTWLDADDAFWVGAVRLLNGAPAQRDPQLGWRVAALERLDSARFDCAEQRRRTKRANTHDPGQTSCALAAEAGRFRVYRLRAGELVDLDSFRQTDHYDFFYRSIGISDRIWVVFPMTEDTECCYCLDKYGENRQFSQDDAELAGQVLRGMKWFHRQVLLSHGLGIAETPLTPNERRVLRVLLTGATAKALADSLGVTAGTAHQYSLALYRKFGVSSKAELLSLWLSRG